MSADNQTILAAGLADPVYDSQTIFRSVLSAFSRPGRLSTVATDIKPPQSLHTATAAIALSLFDLSTPYWIAPAIGTNAAIDYIGFHAGARTTDKPSNATFAIVGGNEEDFDWDGFAIGTSDYPDRSTTIIVQVDDLQEGGPVCLTGPGIEAEHRISVAGVNVDFWTSRKRNTALYPLGTDTILVARNRIVCLPRTTKVEI